MSSYRYQPGVLDNAEDLEKYQPGGYHPIHIGDGMDGGRYSIIHKLGYGGFATVWLARDQRLSRYVALKIITAEASVDCPELKILQHLENSTLDHPGREYVATLGDHFRIEGPNGSHLCLVSQVLGPSIPQRSKTQPHGRLAGNIARTVALQTARGLDFIHSASVGHGDLTPSNILFQFANFDIWSEDEIYERLGQPYRDEVWTTSGDNPEPSAPAYVVEPINMSELDDQYLSENISIIDLGQSFLLDKLPPDGVGTPMSYRAPEAYFDSKAGVPSDIWALACSIFEIRAGQAMFPTFFSPEDEVLRLMVQTLGKLPQPWWDAWGGRLDYFDETGNPRQDWEDGIPKAVLYPLKQQIIDIGDEDVQEQEGDIGGKSDQDYNDAIDTRSKGGKGRWEIQRAKLSTEEVASMHDLLSKMLVYEAEERPSAEEVSRHPWFTYEARE